MNIAHVNAIPGYGGGEVQLFLLLDGLRARGIHVTLFAPPHSASAAEARRRNLPLIPLAPRNGADLPMMWRLRRALRTGGYDLVHLHSGHAIWLGAMAAAPLNIPIVATKRMDRPIRPGLKRHLIWHRWVDAAVGISTAVSNHYRAARIPESRIHTIFSVLDPSRTHPTRPRDDVRRELGCAPGTTLLLSLGTLTRRKATDILLRALALLPRTPPTLACIAGDGVERRSLEKLATELKLGGSVKFLGHRPDAAELLNAADVFVMSSRSEGLGNAALEAMGIGKPVVASAAGGLRDVVADGVTGRLVPPDDPAALADALRELIADPARRAVMGEAGRARVAAEFSADHMVDQYLALYRSQVAATP